MAVVTRPVIDWTGATKPSSAAEIITLAAVPGVIGHTQIVLPAPQIVYGGGGGPGTESTQGYAVGN